MTTSFYLLDGHGYIYQAFFAVSNNLHASDGTPTNAVFGFAKLLEKIFLKRPDYLAVCFDAPGPKLRQKVFSDYKATRKPMPEGMQAQIPLIKEMLQAYRIAMFEKESIEADDLLATIAKQVSQQGVDVYLASHDKDLQQIVNERIKILDLKEDLVVDRARIQQHWQIEPERMVDYFALVGDAVDNIPGVPGIGPKTAIKLLQTWHNLADIYTNINQIKPERVKNLLIQHRESALLSRTLCQLDDQIDLPFSLAQCRFQEGDRQALQAFFQKLDFQTFLARLSDQDLPQQTSALEQSKKKQPHPRRATDAEQQQEFDW